MDSVSVHSPDVLFAALARVRRCRGYAGVSVGVPLCDRAFGVHVSRSPVSDSALSQSFGRRRVNFAALGDSLSDVSSVWRRIRSRHLDSSKPGSRHIRTAGLASWRGMSPCGL